MTVAVVGAGAAGLALACRLAEQGRDDVVLVQSPQAAPARTWCSWHAGPQWWDDAVSHTWHRIALHGPDGRRREHGLGRLRYVQVRSRDYEALADRLLDGRVRRVTAHVTSVQDGRVRGDGVDLQADAAFDTRPTAPARRGRTSLLQHFRGWYLRTSRDAFDPTVAGFMDFRVPQPGGGVAFVYVLATSAREALVEHTEFTRAVLDDAGYDAALRRATRDLPPFEVLEVEDGVIPMTDAPFPRRVDARTYRLGAAGGATRPSTGYTFTAAQRQAAAVAEALREGRDPTPPPAYPARHLRMDALLLRALDRGLVEGDAFFTRLFDRQPAERVLRFLDGATTPAEDLAVMAAAPPLPMLRALLTR